MGLRKCDRVLGFNCRCDVKLIVSLKLNAHERKILGVKEGSLRQTAEYLEYHRTHFFRA